MNNSFVLYSLFALINRALHLRKLFRSFCALLCNLSLLLNSFLPYFAAIPAYAADISPLSYSDSTHKLYFSIDNSNSVSYQLFYKTDTKIDSVSGSNLPEYLFLGTCSDGSCLSQNFESAILKTKTDSSFYYYYFTLKNGQLQIVKEGTSSQFDLTNDENSLLENGIIVVTSSLWTFEKVELNKEYVAPQNSGVKLTFTKLPESSGNIKIEEITLTPEQITQTGSLSAKAYDITSDMTDGSFAYNLSLPIPESSKGKSVDIKFAENVSEINSAQTVDNTITNTDTSVSVTNLDHFTIFIITDDIAIYSGGTWIDYATQGYSDDGVHYPATLPEGQTATWTFSSITPGSYNVYTSWSTHTNRTTSAPYNLNYSSGSSSYVVNQEQLADQTTTGSSGQWSGWYKLGTFDLNTSSNLVLTSTNNTSGTDYVIADEVLLAPNTAPATIWIDDNYNFNSKNDGHVWGYDAFTNIQDGVNAVAADGTINIAAGTYTEIGQIVINKNLSIVGADKTSTIIKPAQNTGNTGDSRGWILVNLGNSFNLKNVTLDGADKLINIGILSHGPGTIENNIIKNIGYNPSGPDYAGRGLAFYDTNVSIINNFVQNYGRIGIYVYGLTTALIEGNTIQGKGTGNHLDYAVEVEGGASAEIKGNTISNNQGVATVDGSVSAGILATTYFASGTNVKLINNSINDNSYGITLGYNNDTTTVSQFDGNIFSNNTYDFDNYTINNIDARNNNWSVIDQNNIDQIEAKINHYCSGSTYVHGACSGTDDYSTGFGMVQYKNIGTPTNSGWNLQSESVTPNETPLDVACGGYSNENSVAQNWTAVNGTNIKYQREVTFPSNAISNIEAGSNTYTSFSTFGSGTGTEGLWKTKVRAYVDANSNNKYDSGEDVSNWSNECQITFDKTSPTNPGTPVASVTSPTNQTTITWNWTVATDTLSGIKDYLWNLWKNTTKILSGTTTNTNQTLDISSYGDGNFSLDVQSEDNAGNVSGVVTSTATIVDTFAPDIPTLNSPIDGFVTKGVAFTQSWYSVVGAVLYEYESCNIDPGDIGGTCSNKKYSSTYTGTTKNVGAGQPNSHFWWRVRAKDNAGNWSGWSESRELIIDNTAPTATVSYSTTSWTNGDVTATIVPSEDVTITNNSGSTQYIFSNNGNFTFEFVDAAGNTGSITATVNNIDKTAPIFDSKTDFSGWYTANKTSIFNYTDSLSGIASGNPVSCVINTQGTNKTCSVTPNVCDNVGNCNTTPVTSNGANIDKSNPTNIWINPIEGQYVKGIVDLNVNANDTISGLDFVRLRYGVDTSHLKTLTGTTWDTTSLVDGNYVLRSRAQDISGRTNIKDINVIVDNTAPTSTIDGGINNGIIYSNTWNGLITGTATDNLSGINKVLLSIKRSSDAKYYSLEDGWIDGTEETTRVIANNTTIWDFTLPEPLEDTYTITSHAVDNAGNTENTYTLTIILDKTISEVTLSIDPTVGDASNGWYKTQPTITLTQTDDNFDRIEYQWDSKTEGSWITYSTPFKLETEGSHVLYYRAVDKANNISDIGIKNIAWDQTDLEYGPQNISANPNPTSGSTSKIKWDTAKDNIGIDKYEVQWSLNGTNYSKTVGAGTTEVEIDNLTEGNWSVKVVAFDQSGRSKDAGLTLTVDRAGPTAPTLTLVGTGTGTATLSWNVISDAKDYIIWYGNSPGSRLYGARVGNVNSYTVAGLGAGNYYFIVKAVDEAQNQSSESNEVNTGLIVGAAGVTPGTPAEGFTSQVLGTTTEPTTISPTISPVSLSNILGVSTENISYLWWLLSILPFSFILWLILKRRK